VERRTFVDGPLSLALSPADRGEGIGGGDGGQGENQIGSWIW